MDLNRVVSNLEGLGYIVRTFKNKEDCAGYLNGVIDNRTVGFGGSVTLRELGLYESLSLHNRVYWHWQNDELSLANNTDIYLSSVNGMSEDGHIVNIDGTGNRVSNILYGHKKCYFILGINKIAADLEGAMFRARNVAAVKNAIRLERKTPCVKMGRCMDCSSPERICRAFLTLSQRPGGMDYEVLIIEESLGY